MKSRIIAKTENNENNPPLTEENGEEENSVITEEDFKEFLSAKTYEEQFRILLAHAAKNQKYIEIRRLRNMENYQVGSAVSQEEISKQFEEFCHTKGIAAKFKVAFEQMGENTRRQHEQDKANIEAVKNSEENKDFKEFLHAKGIKAKCRLVIEGFKKSARESGEKTRQQIAASRARTQASINAHSDHSVADYTAEQLTAEFNAFLQERGLADKYAVEVVEE